jgi:hypothetical protein
MNTHQRFTINETEFFALCQYFLRKNFPAEQWMQTQESPNNQMDCGPLIHLTERPEAEDEEEFTVDNKQLILAKRSEAKNYIQHLLLDAKLPEAHATQDSFNSNTNTTIANIRNQSMLPLRVFSIRNGVVKHAWLLYVAPTPRYHRVIIMCEPEREQWMQRSLNRPNLPLYVCTRFSMAHAQMHHLSAQSTEFALLDSQTDGEGWYFYDNDPQQVEDLGNCKPISILLQRSQQQQQPNSPLPMQLYNNSTQLYNHTISQSQEQKEPEVLPSELSECSEGQNRVYQVQSNQLDLLHSSSIIGWLTMLKWAYCKVLSNGSQKDLLNYDFEQVLRYMSAFVTRDCSPLIHPLAMLREFQFPVSTSLQQLPVPLQTYFQQENNKCPFPIPAAWQNHLSGGVVPAYQIALPANASHCMEIDKPHYQILYATNWNAKCFNRWRSFMSQLFCRESNTNVSTDKLCK